MADEGFKRKLTAILSADVVGYSHLMEDNEDATIQTLNSYRISMSTLVQQHRGRVVDMTGDNLMAEFSSVVDAVKCAVETQREMSKRNAELPENRRMLFRIGVNLGDIVEEKDRIYGDGVNIAARLEGLAEAGGICISRTAYDQVKKKLELGYEYLGEHSVKNISEPVHVYRVLMEPEAVGKVIGEKRKEKRRMAIAALIILLIGVAGLAGWYLYLEQSKKVEPASMEKMAFPLPDKPSIAVLSFDNLIGDPSQEYFCDGMAEEIITALSKVDELFVIAPDSSFSYKGKPVKVQKISEELGIRYVLEGSVRKEGNRVRVNAHLIDALTGQHLFSERYDRELEGIFALQDEIAIKVLTAVKVVLTDREMARFHARGVSNIDAYFKLLEAFAQVQHVNKESNAIARRLAKEAILLEPGSSRAHQILAFVHFWDYWLGPPKSPGDSITQGIKMAKKAIELDEYNSFAQTLLGMLYVNKGEYDKAVEEAERGVSLEPNSAQALVFYGSTLMHACRFEDAISVFQKYLRLSPVKPMSGCLQNLGICYRELGKYDESVHYYKRLLEVQPDHFIAHLGLTATYSMMGRVEDAQIQATHVMRINPKFSAGSFAKKLQFKNRAVTENFFKALRKAGIPE